MDEKLRIQFRERLHQEAADLRAADSDTLGDRAPVELDQTSVGRLSRMDAMQQQEMFNACRTGYKKHLQDVQYALLNIEQGEYGWCEHCGESIDLRRLEVKPESRFCIGCQCVTEQRQGSMD